MGLVCGEGALADFLGFRRPQYGCGPTSVFS